jgi:hypothetical protein
LLPVLSLDHIPPLGFEPEPTLTFGHSENLDCDPAKDFPVVSTCTNSLRLPVLMSYDDFARNMLSAISFATTFSLA